MKTDTKSEDKLRTLVAVANKNRAIIYLHLWRVLEAELGGEKAAALMSKALYEKGAESVAGYSEAARSGDFAALAEEFVSRKEGDADVFGRGAEAPGVDGVTLILKACPLVEGWREAGLSDEDIQHMCHIARAVDFGKFETMGYDLGFDSCLGEGDGSCRLCVKKRP